MADFEHSKYTKKVIGSKMKKSTCFFVEAVAGCVDCDTEFLTSEGWKKISHYKPGDKIKEYDLDQGEVEGFKTPRDHVTYKSEYLTRVVNNRIDMVVSSKHKIIYAMKNNQGGHHNFSSTLDNLILSPKPTYLPYIERGEERLTDILFTLEAKPYKTLDGKMYCFTTSSGYWLARRNGKIFPTGNSGKSTTVVAHSLSLHLREIVPAHKHRLITFSRASAKDLQGKISKEYQGVERKSLPKATTIHSMATNILRTNFKLRLTAISEWNATMLMRDILEGLGVFQQLGVSKKVAKSILSRGVVELLTKLKTNMLISYDDILEEEVQVSNHPIPLPIKMGDEVYARAYKLFEEEKRKANIIDYTDMIFYTLHLLTTNKKVLKEVRQGVDFLVGDEQQDTCRMENALMLTIIQGKRLTVAGDCSQSIYGWRDADSSLFSVDFLSRYFDKVKTFELPINYRSTPAIVEFGNKVREYREDNLRAIPFNKKVKDSLKLHRVANSSQEAKMAVRIIQESIAKGYAYKDIAIIVRGNQTITSTIEPILEANKIPYHIPSRTIKKKLSERDLTILYRLLLQMILDGVKGILLSEVLFYLEGFGEAVIRDYGEAIRKEDFNSLKRDKPKIYDSLTEFTLRLKSLHGKCESGDLDFSHLSQELSAITRAFVKEKLQSFKKREEIAKSLGSLYHYYNSELGILSIEEILLNTIDDFDGNSQVEDKNEITVSTVHFQKGLSQPVSIAMGFTSWKEREVDNEEVCVFYVQCSRAEKELHLIYSDVYVTKRGREMVGFINPVLKNVLNLIQDT